MAGFKNLGDVYSFVTSRAGDCAPTDVELVIADALYAIRDSLGMAEDEVVRSLSTAANLGQYDIPAGLQYVKSVRLNACVLPPGSALCRCSSSSTAEHTGTPDSWEILEGKLTLHPVPDKGYQLELRGYASQDYLLKAGDVWRMTADVLPEGLGHCLAKWACALALLDARPDAASTLIGIAQTDLQNWKERKRTLTEGFVLGGGCRDHEHEPRLYERFVR